MKVESDYTVVLDVVTRHEINRLVVIPKLRYDTFSERVLDSNSVRTARGDGSVDDTANILHLCTRLETLSKVNDARIFALDIGHYL